MYSGRVNEEGTMSTASRTVREGIVAGFVITIVGVGMLTAPMRPVLPWWSIVVANTLAVIPAGRYLNQKRPGLSGRLLIMSA